jgi:hypothetical protein
MLFRLVIQILILQLVSIIIFSYRGFNLNVLLDIKEGGDIYSRNLADLQRNGVTSETAEFDRFNADGTALAKPYIFEGVLPDGTENLASNPNAVRVTAEQYWGNSGKFLAARGFIFDASWFRVREAALTYSLPKKVLKNTFLGNVEVGFSVETCSCMHLVIRISILSKTL